MIDNWQRLRAVVESRFWPRVNICASDACWPWKRSIRTGGYGQFRPPAGWCSKNLLTAPRVALMLHLDRELLPDHEPCHTCDYPPCCNPAHLIEGTRSQNLRMRSAEKASRAGCSTGTPRNHGEKQRIAQLTSRMRVCECGMETNAGAMAHHLKRSGHVLN